MPTQLLNSPLLIKGAMYLHLLLFLSFVSPSCMSQQLSLLLDQQFFHYQEYSDDGGVLDSEKGWLFGPLIRYGHQFKSGFELIMSASLLAGAVTYEGHTQAGKNHHTDTKENLQRLNVALLYTAAPSYGAGINVERFIWDRDIQPNLGVLGLHETYSWLALSFSQNLQLTDFELSLSVGKLINGNIRVDLNEINKGLIDVPLKSGVQIEFYINYKKNITERVYVYSRFSGLWRYFNKSDVVRSGNSLFSEPQSETFQAGGALGVSYSF